MESAVVQRIRKVAESKGLSVTALSKMLGVVQQTLNRQISGDGAMPLSTIDKFLSCFPEISAEWLLRGEGAMIKGDNEAKVESGRKFVVCVDENGFLKLDKVGYKTNHENPNKIGI